VLIEPPVDITDDRNRYVFETDLDPLLRRGRHPVLTQLREPVFHISGEIPAFRLASLIGDERQIAIEDTLRRLDTGRQITVGPRQAVVDTLFCRAAPRRRRTDRRPAPEQSLHDPKGRLGGPEVE